MDLYIAFKLFFIAVCGDFITGVTASAKEGKLKSRRCSDGIFRSIGEVMILVMFMIVAELMPELHGIILTFIVGFMLKEALSICENLTRLGVWLPQSLTDALEVGKNKIDRGEDINGSKINSTN